MNQRNYCSDFYLTSYLISMVDVGCRLSSIHYGMLEDMCCFTQL